MGTDRLVYQDRRGKIATITIDNPPLNVLSMRVAEEFEECVTDVAADPGVSVVVVTGAGERAFMAGGDIKEFPRLLGAGAEAVQEHALRMHRPFNMLGTMDKPTIASITGLALGGGCELALACDLRVAEEGAEIGLPEIKLGIFPGAGGTQRLSRIVGSSRAKQMMFTGEPISAKKAEGIGLVDRVVASGEALSAALELAQEMTRLSLPALSRIKRSVDEGTGMPLLDGLEVEARYFGEVFQTYDAREGVAAFIEKRKPDFFDR